MFNANTVKSELITLIGWRKSTDPTETNNPMGDLLTATSGQYYNDQHPLLTVTNLKSVADTFSDYTYSAWSALTTYVKGDIVTSGGNYYVSVVDANLNHAVSLTAYWRQTTPFNEWLRVRTESGIIETVNDLLGLKFERKTAANLLKRSQVLNPPGTKTESVGDTARYVGWSVTPSPLQDIIVTIDRISIQMTGSEQTTVELYKNGGSTPISSVVIEGDGTSDVIWAEAGWELERGNFYYVMVDRDDLNAAIPINALAGMDNAGSYNRFPGTLPFAEMSGFEHAGPGEDGWNDVASLHTNTNNYGLNLQMSARCDYTEFIVDQKNILVNAICKRVAMNMLRELAFNATAKINRNELNVPRETLMYELDGNPMGRQTGIGKQYKEALNAVTFDTKALSQYSFPSKSHKLKYGSV